MHKQAPKAPQRIPSSGPLGCGSAERGQLTMVTTGSNAQHVIAKCVTLQHHDLEHSKCQVT